MATIKKTPGRRTHAKENHDDDVVVRVRGRNRAAAHEPTQSGGDDSPSARLADLIGQFSGATGFRALVERTEQGSESEYLGTVPLDEQLFDTVGARWGGGRFSARVLDAAGKYAGRIPPFRIAGKPHDETRAPVAVAGPIASGEPSRMEILMERILGELTAAKQPALPASADPFDQFSKVAKAIREAAPPAFDMTQMFGLMNGMLEMRERIADSAPEPTKSSGLLEAVREMKPIMGRLLDVNDQRNAATAPQLPAPAPPMPPNCPAWLQPFCKYKGFLIEAADAGKGAAPIAGLVVENATDAQWNDVAQSDAVGTLAADIFAAFPELQATDARKAFAAEIVSELRTSLHPAAEAPEIEG